jgi:5-hydroxyisourate hydrolase-like protein (transthyretin family)
MEVPVKTVLKLSITDSTGDEVMKLIDDQTVSSGIYRVRWEMEDYPAGRYWCEFTTEQFIYRKDFFIK